jgi:hypothetical protein
MQEQVLFDLSVVTLGSAKEVVSWGPPALLPMKLL